MTGVGANSWESKSSVSGSGEAIAFSKSDFTFPLEKQLAGVKYAYSFFRIVLFVETGLIALSILGLMLLSHGIKSKFRWIAATLAITGIWGFVLIALNNITLSIATGVANNVQNEAASVVGPIVIALLSKLFSAYTTNQGVMSIAMFLVAAVFLTVGELTNKSVIVKSIPKKVSNIKKK